MAFNPPYRLSPLENIVNVKWASGDFFWNIGPINTPTKMLGQMCRGTGGSTIEIPTDTFSANCDIFTPANPPVTPFPIVEHRRGDRLTLSFPTTVRMDHRGYTEMVLTEWDVTTDPSGEVSGQLILSGEKLILDTSGGEIDFIPADSAQDIGVALVSDEEGTVYVLGSGSTPTWTIKKYSSDSDGDILWTISNHHTFYYDEELQQIIATRVQSNGWVKHWYNLSGVLVQTVDDPPDLTQSALEFTKSGKVFSLNPGPSLTKEIYGFDIDGSQLFKIDAPADDQPNPIDIIAIDEGRFVVVARLIVNSGNQSTIGQTTEIDTYLRLYNSGTGIKTSEAKWDGTGINFSQDIVDSNPPPVTEFTALRDAPRVSFIQRSDRRYWWPLSDWPPPPPP